MIALFDTRLVCKARFAHALRVGLSVSNACSLSKINYLEQIRRVDSLFKLLLGQNQVFFLLHDFLFHCDRLVHLEYILSTESRLQSSDCRHLARKAPASSFVLSWQPPSGRKLLSQRVPAKMKFNKPSTLHFLRGTWLSGSMGKQ